MKKITAIVILLALLSIISNVVFASSTNSTNPTSSTTSTTLTAKVTAPATIEAYDGGTISKTVDITVTFDKPVSKGAFSLDYEVDENGGYNEAYISYKSTNIEGIKDSEDGRYLEFDLGEKTIDKIVITCWADGETGYTSILKFVAREGSFANGDVLYDNVKVEGKATITLTEPKSDLPDHFNQSDGPVDENNNTTELSKRTLTDSATEVEVTVNTEDSAKLKVEKLEKEADAYKKLAGEIKNYTIASAYDISIEQGRYEGDILVILKVDKKYEGKDACILHLKSDGTIEKLEDKVTDGKVEVVVSELSPFLVGVSEPKARLDNSPQTGDNFAIPIVASLMILTLGAVIKLRKN